MTVTKDLLNLSQTIQAANLVGHNLKVSTKKKKTTKDFLDLGATNILGTSFIKVQGQLASDIV